MEYGVAFWQPLCFIFAEKLVKPRLINFIPAFIWAVIIYILLVMPAADIPASPFFELVHFDKWVHASLFGTLTFLICFPFFKTTRASLSFFIWIGIASLAYGIIMEFVQKYLTTDRDYDVWDMAADAAGVILGCAFTNILYKRYLRKQQAAL